ncbi:MAG: NAD(P)H-dependent oxidoreductase [Thermoleophilaceae bacterium]|nr:NAD(P)H-dependent oxidoreductase [Thermoleophilaceae bacterium]
MKVLGISGSLRRDSLNTVLLLHAATLLGDGVEFEHWQGLSDLPHYNQDLEDDPESTAVEALRTAIRDADALLIATPEFNGTIPGALKNAIDWTSRPREDAALKNKPVLVIGGSPGHFGAVSAQNDLRRSLGVAGARTIKTEVAIPSLQDAFTQRGTLADATHTAKLSEALNLLITESVPPVAAVSG